MAFIFTLLESNVSNVLTWRQFLCILGVIWEFFICDFILVGECGKLYSQDFEKGHPISVMVIAPPPHKNF